MLATNSICQMPSNRLRRAGFLPWQYIFIRAYGEVFRRLPLVIYADQNGASMIGAPLDTVYFDRQNLPILLYSIRDPFMRSLVEQRATRLYSNEWDKLEHVAAEFLQCRT